MTSFVSEDSLQRGYINYTRVSLSPSFLPTTPSQLGHCSTTLHSLSYRQWTLSLISSTFSQVPLMMRVYLRMKKVLRATLGLAHRCVPLHEIPRFSLHTWRLLRPFKRSSYVFFFLCLDKNLLLMSWDFSETSPTTTNVIIIIMLVSIFFVQEILLCTFMVYVKFYTHIFIFFSPSDDKYTNCLRCIWKIG